MDYKDLYPKLDKVLDGISQEDLCQFAKAYAMSNKDMALALVERFWLPDGEDYRETVDACFVHPFVVSTKFGESLDWNAVTEDVVALMQKIREDKDGKDIIGAAQMALYLMVRTCEEYDRDHPYKDYYNEAWIERWRPLMDAVRECHKMVCELLIDGEKIDDDTQRGLISEMAERIKELKKCPLINMDFVIEDIQEKLLSPKRYLTYLNNKIKKGVSYDEERFFRKKLRFLDKIGKRQEALADINKLVANQIMAPLRTVAIVQLMEWGEYERALELIRSVDEQDFYAYSGKYDEKLVDVLEKLGDRNRSVDILKTEFVKAGRKEVYFKRLRELLDKQEWEEFISDIMADADHVFEQDYDDIEAKIYMERKEYDKLILFCRHNDYQADENLKKYGKYMPLEDQKEVAEYIADRTKRCVANCKRSKDYAYHVVRIQEMIDSCESGKIVAKELIAYLYEHYSSRPALTGMLRDLKGV